MRKISALKNIDIFGLLTTICIYLSLFKSCFQNAFVQMNQHKTGNCEDN